MYPNLNNFYFGKNITDLKVKFQGNVIPQVKSVTHVGHDMGNSSQTKTKGVNKVCKILIV